MSKDYYKISSFEEWLTASCENKYIYKWYLPFLLYKKPYALPWNEWKIFLAYVKKEYPVQFFFRETMSNKLYFLKLKFLDFYISVKDIIWCPRKEMRDKVFPRKYMSLNAIHENFHHEFIIEAVKENERCKKDGYQMLEPKLEKQLNKYYKYVTEERVEALSDYISGIHRSDSKKKIQRVYKKDHQLVIWISENAAKF